MKPYPAPLCLVPVAALALTLLTAGGALALQLPGRTSVRNGPVRLVALNNASFAFTVARTKTDCDHVELWNTNTKGFWRFGKPGACVDLGSTGTGISSIGVSGKRALWIRYTGGNTREWQLMTATTTQKAPKQLRFVAQDVHLPSPMVIGDSTGGLGIPYAVGRQVVLLGENGVAVFKATEPAPITLITAGKGPAGAVVAALRKTGEIEMLKADGSHSWTVGVQPGAVKALALAPVGLVVQRADEVQIRTPAGSSSAVTLPAGALMTDFFQGRILYRRNNEIHALKISNGRDTLLLQGSAGAPAISATADTHGFGWAQGRKVNLACGSCVTFAP
ncbi:MAG: hypothetical protein EXQ81_04375 [Thermoleophilia bacterium]|nr:hypothetical protein [Thermoleophilia bacterium]